MPLQVLIVDDNQDHADSLATLVGLWGHTATVAYDGELGWRAATETAPDCLILDINMPKINGYALAGMIRRQQGLERTRLISVSAYSHPDHIRRVQEACFDHNLTKPVPLEQLQRLLQMMENILKLTEQTERLTRKNTEAAERTEELAKQNVALAGETKELLKDVKEGLSEVKQDVQDIKDEVKGLKAEVLEAKKQVEQDRNEDGHVK